MVIYTSTVADKKEALFTSDAFGVFLILIFLASFALAVYIIILDSFGQESFDGLNNTLLEKLVKTKHSMDKFYSRTSSYFRSSSVGSEGWPDPIGRSRHLTLHDTPAFFGADVESRSPSERPIDVGDIKLLEVDVDDATPKTSLDDQHGDASNPESETRRDDFGERPLDDGLRDAVNEPSDGAEVEGDASGEASGIAEQESFV